MMKLSRKENGTTSSLLSNALIITHIVQSFNKRLRSGGPRGVKMTTLHHVNDPVNVCPLCEKKLSEGHPLLRTWYIKIKKSFGDDVHVSWCYRDQKDQDKCFAEGTSKLKYPNSAHNRCDKDGKPRSTAMDLFRLLPDGIASFNLSWYKQIAKFLKDKEAPLFSGVVWKGLNDAGHFQVNMDNEG